MAHIYLEPHPTNFEMTSAPHISQNMDWSMRGSTSTITTSATNNTTRTSSTAASTIPSTRDIGVQLISESEILSQPPLAALCFRAIDARAGSESVLGDKFAAHLADSLNINTSRIGSKPDLTSELMCLRAMIIDVYCLKFADANSQGEGCTILNLTTGLDTRFMRLKPRPHVRWVEVDTPEFTHLRQRVFPSSNNTDRRPRHSHIASSAASMSSYSFRHEPQRVSADSGFASGHKSASTNSNILELVVENLADTDSWLPQIPADRPTLVIMEAGAWTTRKPDFLHIMRSVVNHFPHGGRIVFDVMSRLNALMFRYKAIPPIRMFTFKIHWHCDDAVGLGKEIHEGLRFLEKKGYHDATTDDNEEWMPNFYGGKLRSKLLTKMPGFSNNLRILFYEFGERRESP